MTALHEGWCSRPDPRPDREGILRCPSCKFLAPVPKARAQVATGYVCRDHHTQPVRFPSGKGCTLCPKRQPKERKAIEPRADNERTLYLT